MTRARILVTGLFASTLTLGCTPDNGGNDTQGATTSTLATTSGDGSGSVTSAPGSATDGTGTESTPTTTITTSTSGTTDTSTIGEPCNFLSCDDMSGPSECDPWAQDCLSGQKCTAYISDGGGAWNSTTCVDVTGTDQPGEQCTTDDVASGIDSCIKGAMCFYVDKEGVGTCLALCTGSPEAPLCDAGFFCPLGGDGVLNLCIPTCDPLLQDCPKDLACYPTHDTFLCAPDVSGDEGQANDPCEFLNVCDEGLMCGSTEFVGAGCMPGATGCCTPFCKFPDGTCPNPDQQCVQYFDPMQLPENDPYLDIGVCGIPD